MDITNRNKMLIAGAMVILMCMGIISIIPSSIEDKEIDNEHVNTTTNNTTTNNTTTNNTTQNNTANNTEPHNTTQNNTEEQNDTVTEQTSEDNKAYTQPIDEIGVLPILDTEECIMVVDGERIGVTDRDIHSAVMSMPSDEMTFEEFKKHLRDSKQ